MVADSRRAGAERGVRRAIGEKSGHHEFGSLWCRCSNFADRHHPTARVDQNLVSHRASQQGANRRGARKAAVGCVDSRNSHSRKHAVVGQSGDIGVPVFAESHSIPLRRSGNAANEDLHGNHAGRGYEGAGPAKGAVWSEGVVDLDENHLRGQSCRILYGSRDVDVAIIAVGDILSIEFEADSAELEVAEFLAEQDVPEVIEPGNDDLGESGRCVGAHRDEVRGRIPVLGRESHSARGRDNGCDDLPAEGSIHLVGGQEHRVAIATACDNRVVTTDEVVDATCRHGERRQDFSVSGSERVVEVACRRIGRECELGEGSG